MDDPERLLRIYLNDHLAAATGAVALARRMRRANPDGELARFLDGLLEELAEERAAVERVIGALGFRRSAAKPAAARLAVTAGRLKLNGRLRGYSDLSRVLELEGLLMAIAMKRAFWTGLAETGRTVPVDLVELVRRADRQREAVARHHDDAVRRAFGTAGVGRTA